VNFALKTAGALALREAGLSREGRGVAGAAWVGLILAAGFLGAGGCAAASRVALRASAVRKAFMRTDYTEREEGGGRREEGTEFNERRREETVRNSCDRTLHGLFDLSRD